MAPHRQQHMQPAVEVALLVTRSHMEMCRWSGSRSGRPASVTDYMAHCDMSDNWQWMKVNPDCVWLGDEVPTLLGTGDQQ